MSKDEKRPPEGSTKALYDAIEKELLARGHVLTEVTEEVGIRKGWQAGFNVDGVHVPIHIEEERQVRHSYHFHYTGNLIVRCAHLWGPKYKATISSKTFRPSKARPSNFGIDIKAVADHIRLYVETSKEQDKKHTEKKSAKAAWKDQLALLEAKFAVPEHVSLEATEKGIELMGLFGVGDLEKILKAICK